jgi:hypothetical protein
MSPWSGEYSERHCEYQSEKAAMTTIILRVEARMTV